MYQIKTRTEEIDRLTSQISELESRLVKEEEELDEVRDSLRGKTDQFTTQIEARQRELEPWMAQIHKRQSAYDVAESEKKILAARVTSGENALQDARAALEDIVESFKSKVR